MEEFTGWLHLFPSVGDRPGHGRHMSLGPYKYLSDLLPESPRVEDDRPKVRPPVSTRPGPPSPQGLWAEENK